MSGALKDCPSTHRRDRWEDIVFPISGGTDEYVQMGWFCRSHMSAVKKMEEGCAVHPWSSNREYVPNFKKPDVLAIIAWHKDKLAGAVQYQLNTSNVNVLRCIADPEYVKRGVGYALVQTLAHRYLNDDRSFMQSAVPRDEQLIRALLCDGGMRIAKTLRAKNQYLLTKEFVPGTEDDPEFMHALRERVEQETQERREEEKRQAQLQSHANQSFLGRFLYMLST